MRRFGIIVFCILLLGRPVDSAIGEEPLPNGLTAAILVKLLELEETRCKSPNIRIHVVDDLDLAESLQKLVGTPINNVRLSSVSFGTKLPKGGTDVVVFSGPGDVSRYVAYAREVGALSVTNNRRNLESGASLAIFNNEGIPGILLNHESSVREGMKWLPEILEVAEIYSK